MNNLNFKIWFENITLGTEEVDERQIDSAYGNAKFAVKLVQMYDKTLAPQDKLLLNINTIATLSQGVYGLYNSKENKQVIADQIPAGIVNKIKMIFGSDVIGRENIDSVPKDILKGIPLAVIKQKIPEININALKPSDVIHVNIQKHLMKYGDSPEAIRDIASTIVHEATHALDTAKTGNTSEGSAQNAEKRFLDWFYKNLSFIQNSMPIFKNLKER